MSWKRILRDSSIVAALCATFYLTASAIDNYVKPEDRVYSKDRRLADQYYADRSWELASFHYKKLTEKDRFNGYAWFQQAVCQLGLRADVIADLKAQRAGGAAEEVLESLESKQEAIEDQVIHCFVQASDFYRHRRRSLVNMAIVYTGRSDWNSALKYLDIYVKEGILLTRTLDQISSLGVGGRDMVDQPLEENPEAGLHRFSKFWDLVEFEYRLRGGGLPGGAIPSL